MERKYGIVKQVKSEFPVRELLLVPHKDGDLILSYPAFGPDYFRRNIAEMKKFYSHPETGEKISFRQPTTFESISAAAYNFENIAKPEIFDPRWLQIGYIVVASEGVYANPPRDVRGDPIIDEQTLKLYLNGVTPVNGIRLLGNGFGFAPYETFETGVQDCDFFAEGGLARVLEHTNEKTAKKLREIASPKFYKRGVNVFGFDKVKEPALRVVSLGSCRGFRGCRFGVADGDMDGGRGGLAFGVLK